MTEETVKLRERLNECFSKAEKVIMQQMNLIDELQKEVARLQAVIDNCQCSD